VLTDEALRAVSNLPAITSLDLTCCRSVTDEGVRASFLRSSPSCNLRRCPKVTAAGVQALDRIHPHLDITYVPVRTGRHGL
jgi:hypothetical protein